MPRVVTCLLTDNDDNLLILKRSDKVKTYKGLWGGVAGYVEENEEPEDTAFKEIKEEINLEKEDVYLVKKGETIVFTDFYEGEKYDWEVISFLFKTEKKDKLQIDWEHSEYRWIAPPDIGKYDTVPHLKRVVNELLL
jgi:8-oxo-dGTP pyrophosphatase MutT (NUDIX family)